MGISYRERDGAGAYVVSDSCPFCGDDLDDQRSLADHIRGGCPEAP